MTLNVTEGDWTAAIVRVIDHFVLMLCSNYASILYCLRGITTLMPVLLCREVLLTISIDVINLQILELRLVTFVLWTKLGCALSQWTVFICWISWILITPLSLSLLVHKSAASRGLKGNTSLILCSHVTATTNCSSFLPAEVSPISKNSSKFCPRSRHT